jgi:hypothetical protein
MRYRTINLGLPLGPTAPGALPQKHWEEVEEAQGDQVATLSGICPHCGGTSHLGSRMGQKRPPPPGVCCQLDQAGNTVCSDGQIYPPG